MRALSAIPGLAAAGIFAGLASGQPKIHPEEIKLKPQIDAAIGAGVEALTDAQMRNGTWGRYGNFDGGKTALCAYALLSCGVNPTQPVVRRALLYLDGVTPRHTYSVACMMLAYSAAGPQYKKKVKQLAGLLLDWQREGDYGYPYPLSGDGEYSRPDLSNTQYAALGLWIAQKNRVRIPPQVFRSLAMATLQYRSPAETVTLKIAPQKGRGTSAAGGGKRQIRGFVYTRRGKPTGSMTTAGVSILQICKLGLGSRLGKLRRPVDEAIESGVAWLGHHFSVRRNPMGPQKWQLYYLYGLERVGSLVRVEQMGNHWWFLSGARHLLRRQSGKGMWGDEVDTAFALLFLRRATGLSAGAVTGKGAGPSGKKHLFAAGHAFDEVTIGGAGQQPLALWVPGFGEDLKKRHQAHGIRVVQVEYMLGDQVLGQVAGNPTKAWTTDTFLHRVAALRRGVHKIHAKVTVVAPNVRPGDTEPTEAFESPKMDVEIRDVFAEWMKQAAKLASKANLLRDAGVEITATSNTGKAKLAIDANDSTYWVCAAEDEYPELRIKMPKGRGVSARKLVLSQAGATGADRGQFDHILSIEIFVNGEVKPTVVNLDEDQLAVTTFDLSRRRTIKSLRVRIVSRLPGRQAFVAGFSEIALMK